jgi:Mg-chelatase subunit ChlD
VAAGAIAVSGTDLALILAADCSASVTFDEFNLIAGGMAAALRDKQVVHGLLTGPHRATQAAVLLFSGRDAQDVVVDWRVLRSEADAAAFADLVDNMPRVLKAGLTAIGNALEAATVLLARSPERAARSVIDVAGDGRANDGVAPGPVRDALAGAGITINGLCILHEEPDLVATFQRDVIGGPGAFAQTCADYKDFAAAMRRKLLREISDKPVA